ncbi:hypothetical protein KAR91_03100 [Candidatus Pacearchaeota archaeon]|nr:hypothetical protein [Candidatus Pacearchaeota archaeon]
MIVDLLNLATLGFIIMVASYVAGYMAAKFETEYEDMVFCTLAGVLVGLIMLALGSLLLVAFKLLRQYIIF